MLRIDAHAQVFARLSREFPRQAGERLPADRQEPVEKLLEEKGFVMTDEAHPSARLNRYLQTHSDVEGLR